MYDFSLRELEDSPEYQNATPDLQQAYSREYVAENGPDEALSSFQEALGSEDFASLPDEEKQSFKNNYFDYYGIKPPQQENKPESSFVTDVKDVVASGLAGTSAVPKAVGELAGFLGFDSTKDALLDIANDTQKFYSSKISPHGKMVQQQSFLSDEDGKWFGDNALKKVFMTSAESLPLMVMTAPIGGGASAGLTKAAQFLPGLVRAIEAGGKVASAAKWGKNLIAYGGSEAGVSALSSAADAGNQIDRMNETQLQKSPVYQKLRKTMGPEEAKQELRGIVEQNTFLTQAAATFVGSAVVPSSGGALPRLFESMGKKGLVKEAVGGFTEEALQEAAQSGFEQFASNRTTQQNIDPNQSLTEGIGENIAIGAASGGLMGGAMGLGAKAMTIQEIEQSVSNIPLNANPDEVAKHIEEIAKPDISIRPGEITDEEAEDLRLFAKKMETANMDQVNALIERLPSTREYSPHLAPEIERILNTRKQELSAGVAEEFNQKIPGAMEDAKALSQQANQDDLFDDLAGQAVNVQDQADVRGRQQKFNRLLDEAAKREANLENLKSNTTGRPSTAEEAAGTFLEAEPPGTMTPEEVEQKRDDATAAFDLGPDEFILPPDENGRISLIPDNIDRDGGASSPQPSEESSRGNSPLPGQSPANDPLFKETETNEKVSGAISSPEESGQESTSGSQPGPTRSLVENEDSVATGQEVTENPTEAQKEAGNYKKAHVSLNGLDISIENPAGSTRSGKDADGKEWSVPMKTDYGYVRGSVGYDKDHVDTFIAPGYSAAKDNDPVFVVNQYNADGSFDEHKVVLGAKSKADALSLYNSNFEPGWDRGRSVVKMSMPVFKKWVKSDAPKKGALGGNNAKIETVTQPVKETSGNGVEANGGRTDSSRNKATTDSKARELGQPAVDEGQSSAPVKSKRFNDGIAWAKKKIADPSYGKDAKAMAEHARNHKKANTDFWKGVLDEAERATVKSQEAAPPSQQKSPSGEAVATESNNTPSASDTSAPQGVKQQSSKSETAKREKTSQSSSQKSESGAIIDDFGEKIGGAKKDYYTSLSQAKEKDIASNPISKTFPEPDYQKLIDDGVDPELVAIVRSLRDEIPTKPRSSWKLGRWAKLVESLRDLSEMILTDEKTAESAKDKIKKSSTLGETVLGRAELYTEVGHNKSLKGVTLKKHYWSLYKGEKNVTKWAVEKEQSATAFSNMPLYLGEGDTKEQAIAGFKESYKNLGKNKSSKKVKFQIYQRRGEKGSYYVGKKVGRNVLELKQFDDVKKARNFINENYDELIKLLEKQKYIPDSRRKSNEERIGKNHRNGKDVTPEMFTEAFGFRGVEFGNWVKATGERQNALNNAYDALMDLSDALGIPSQAMSLNGELGLAFGARGSGGKDAAAAHYEPGKIVINLTRKSGAGSLAHEWWHAIDNYFSRMRNKPDGMMTDQPYELSPQNRQVRKEMVDAFKTLIDAIKNTGIKKRSARLDKKRSKPKWGSDVEISARTFENYVIKKLADEGYTNDYLANIVDKDEFINDLADNVDQMFGTDLDSNDMYPYLYDEELQGMVSAFDKFFDTVQTKVTDKGVALYSQSTQPTTAADIKSELQPHLGVFGLSSLIRRGTLNIVSSQAEAKRIIAKAQNPDALYAKDGQTIQGFTYNGKVHLVADGIEKGQAKAVLDHELGVHLRKLAATDETFQSIKESIESRRDEQSRTGKAIREAYAQVPADTKLEHRTEEALAYLVENHPQVGIVRRVIARIKLMLAELLGKNVVNRMTAADFKALAQIAVKREAVKEGGVTEFAQSAKMSVKEATRKIKNMAAFKKWFDGSKVVDENGEPLVVYHGTPFGNFKESAQRVNEKRKELISYAKTLQGERFDLWNLLDQLKAERDNATKYEDKIKIGRDIEFTRELLDINESLDRKREPVVPSQQEIDAFLFAGTNDSGYLGRGHYFTADKEVAGGYSRISNRTKYPGEIKDPYIYEVFLDIKNPFYKGVTKFTKEMSDFENRLLAERSRLDKTAEQKERTASQVRTETLQEFGFDGVVGESKGNEGTEYVVFKPTQIKSIFNDKWDGSNPDIMASAKKAARAIFSKLDQVTNSDFTGMKAQGVMNFLSKRGVKKAEMEAIGLDAWLKERKPTDKVTQQELSDFVRANAVEVEDVVLGGVVDTDFHDPLTKEENERWQTLRNNFAEWDGEEGGYKGARGLTEQEEEEKRKFEEKHNAAIEDQKKRNKKQGKFSEYTEPNADPGSYREMFVTAPAKAPTFHQFLLDKGLSPRTVSVDRALIKTYREEYRAKYGLSSENGSMDTWQDGHQEYSGIKNPIVRIRFNTETRDGKTYMRIEEMQGPSEENQEKMPSYLKDNIYQLGTKRAIAYAKENGLDGIIFATKDGMTAGETQADRYSLAKQVDAVGYAKNSDGTFEIQGFKGDETVVSSKMVKESELAETVGKSLSKKIIAGEGTQDGDLRVFEGDGLKVTDTGLVGLYDNQLPKMFEAYGKAKTTNGVLPITQKTPGTFPLFSKAAAITSQAFKKWFGKSKITTNGKPHILYHGTSDSRFLQDQSYPWAFDTDRPANSTSSPLAGLGIFLGNEDIALAHSGGNPEAVHTVYVKIENPLVIISQELEKKVTDPASAKAFRKRAIEINGYDGIIIKDRGQVIAFNSNQVKSATDNTGAYSSDPDIRYSIKKKSRTKPQESFYADATNTVSELKDKLDNRWEQFVYWIADKDDPRRRVMNRAQRVSAKTDILTVERLRGKKTADEVERFMDEDVEPLVKTLAKGKLTPADLEEYAYALHVPERNLRMRQVNAKRFIDSVEKHLNTSEKADLEDEMIDIRSEVIMSGASRADRQDQYLGVLDHLFENVDQMREDLDAKRQELEDREFTEAEVAKGTPETLVKRLDSREDRIQEIEALRNRWETESVRYAGITDEEAGEILSKWKKDERIDSLKDANKQLAAINRKRLDILLDAGQLSEREYQSLIDGYEHYVPLHRDIDVDTRPATGRPTGPLGKPLKVAKGSMAEVVHILAHSVRNTQAAITRKHKAEAGKALLHFAQDNPEAGISVGKQEKKPTHDSEGNIVLYENPVEGDDELYLRVDGERYVLTFNIKDPTVKRFLKSIKNTDATLSGPFRALSKVTRFLSSVNTTLSPEFLISNFIRDIQTAGVNMEDSAAKGMQAKVYKNVFPAIYGIFKAEYGNDNSYWGKAYRDFSKNGGKIGWMQSYEEIGDLAKEIDNTFKLHQEGHIPRKAFKHLMNAVERSNTAVENGVRLSVYDQLVKNGVSKQQAALTASNLTVDFTRRGTAGPALNALYMFFNAGVQGNVRLIKAFRRSPRVRAITGGIVATGFALQMLAYATGGDDDTDEPYIDGIPDYIKERNMIFMIPNSGGKYIKVPVPYGYNVFFNAGSEIARASNKMWRGKKYDAAKGSMRVFNSLMDSFNPLQSATLLQAVSPTITDPRAMISENKAWTGSPLFPEQNQFGPQKADSYRFWKSSSGIAKSVAQGLNRLTGGGGEYDTPGLVDVSPETLELWFDTITGSAGRFVKDIVTIPIDLANGEVIDKRRIPFVRRVSGEWNDRAISERYYEASKEVEQFKKVVRGSTREELPELRKRDTWRKVNIITGAEKALQKLRTNKRKAESAGKPTDGFDKRINQVQVKALNMINQVMEKKNGR